MKNDVVEKNTSDTPADPVQSGAEETAAKKKRGKKPDGSLRHADTVTAVSVAAISLGLCLVIECLNHKGVGPLFSFIAGNPLAFIVNWFLIMITLAPAFIFRRRRVYLVLLTALWLAAGVANGVIIHSRMTPFSTEDLAVFADGFEVLPNYLSKFWIVILAIAVAALLFGLVILFIKCPKNKGRLFRRSGLALVAIIIAACGYSGFLSISMNSGAITDTFSNLANAYENYGFGYCFINTWLNTGIDCPDNYSQESVDGILDEIDENSDKSTVSSTSVKDANVIFVQLESFYDPQLIKGLELSGDAVPEWHKLQSEFSHGYLTVPVVGAGTANTEFEVLTGMSTHFFGPGEYPYKTVMKTTTAESIAYTLESCGLSTHAIHNHRGVFYGRNEVYKNLGFDTFTSLEYMQNIETTPKGWAKDSCLTNEISLALDSTKDQKDFVFTVTVQCHGKYPSTQVLDDPAIAVNSIENEDERYAVEYYVNQLHETDEFIADLVSTLEQRDEKTVVVFYADHMPSLGLTASDITTGNIYQTEYLVWDNFGLKNENKDLTSYELSADVLARLGIKGGTISQYHQTCKNTSAYLSGLETLQFDMLYGNQYAYNGVNPYKPTDMRMGISDIEVTSVVKTLNASYIVGNNFTPYCEVTVNGDILDTEYLNSNMLRVKGDIDADSKSDIQISVVEKYKTVLSVTQLVE